MSVHCYGYVETIRCERGHAHILRTLSGKSFVIEIWQTEPRRRLDTRRKRSRESADREARRLLEFWFSSESSYT